jgi:hypothetical protein
MAHVRHSWVGRVRRQSLRAARRAAHGRVANRFQTRTCRSSATAANASMVRGGCTRMAPEPSACAVGGKGCHVHSEAAGMVVGQPPIAQVAIYRLASSPKIHLIGPNPGQGRTRSRTCRASIQNITPLS